MISISSFFTPFIENRMTFKCKEQTLLFEWLILLQGSRQNDTNNNNNTNNNSISNTNSNDINDNNNNSDNNSNNDI